MNIEDETLPNGVYVRRLMHDDAFYGLWLASINITGWHYSNSGTTKEEAIQNLYNYMETEVKRYQEVLRINQERMADLVNFLERQVNG